LQGTQNGALCLQPLLQITPREQPVEASDNNTEGRTIQPPAVDPGVYVRWRS